MKKGLQMNPFFYAIMNLPEWNHPSLVRFFRFRTSRDKEEGLVPKPCIGYKVMTKQVNLVYYSEKEYLEALEVPAKSHIELYSSA